MRILRKLWMIRAIVVAMALSLGWLQIGPAWGGTTRQNWVNRENALLRLEAARRASTLAPGLTQTPDAALRRKIAARERAEAQKPVADIRQLTTAEMGRARGRGPFRNPYFSGTLPWQRSFRDINLCDGNLFKSFTDVQVAPARGAGLVLQRTYNSNDAREGAFGVGWGHAYDIRIQEQQNVADESGNSDAAPVQIAGAAQPGGVDAINEVPRTDFFGAKHTYHRDADGLYSPPPYLYDELSSTYNDELVNGPITVDNDTDKGMDGTVKHYSTVLTKSDGTDGDERGCDSITDRYGNATALAYGQSYVQPDGSTRKLLTSVTDPMGRSLTFHWSNLGTTADPHYRIVQVDAPNGPGTGQPSYVVAYAYYGANEVGNGGLAFQLKSVTLDAGSAAQGHLNRTTTYTYTSVTGTYYTYNEQSGEYDGQSATENGLLDSVTDPVGNHVSYQYAVGYQNGGDCGAQQVANSVWVVKVTEPGGAGPHSWVLAYAERAMYGGQAHFIDPDAAGLSGPWPSGGNWQNYAIGVVYDDHLRVTEVIKSDGAHGMGIAQYAYDIDSNVTSQGNDQDYFGNSQVAVYGQHGNQLTQNAVYSNPYAGTNQTYAHGTNTTYYNGSQYFQKQSASDALGHTTSMGVGTDTAGAVGDPDSNPGDKGQVLWVRDAGYADPNSPSYQKQFTYTYNQYGQKVSETNLKGVTTTYTYGTSGADTGNLVQVAQDPGGTGHLNRTTAMHYDVMGRVLSSTAPSGLTSTFTYNNLGQPLTVVTPARGSVVGETITYVYDDNGRTHSVTDAHRTTTMTYQSGTDFVSSVVDSVTGTTSYTYGPWGERLTMTLQGGGTWTYGYDYVSAYNPQWPNGTDVQYDAMTPDKLDGVHRDCTSIIDDQGRRTEFLYSPTGKLLRSLTDEVFNGAALVSYCQTDYAYNSVNAYSSSNTSSAPPWTPLGQLASVITTWHGPGPAVGGSPPAQVSRVLSRNVYTYDDNGQRLTNTVSIQPLTSGGVPQTNTDGSPVLTGRTETYTYDSLSRLSTVNYGDGESQSYGFDAMGNRLSKSDTVGSTTVPTAYTFDAANRLTGTSVNGGATAPYTSDADGNTLSDGRRTNTWDSQNRLTQCNAVDASDPNTTHHCAYTYGADGLRRSSTVMSESVATPIGGGELNAVGGDPDDGLVALPALNNTTYYVYDGTMLVREMRTINSVLTPTATYLQGPSGPLYRRDDTQGEGTYTVGGTAYAAGKTRWYVSDGLGSVVGEVDPSGTLTSSGTFDVYGARRAGGSTGTATTRQGFVGQLGHVTDSETGLVYMRARYYDSSIGRFVSQDPSMNGSNWFVYCSDNPVNMIDADGKAAKDFWLLGFMGAAIATAAAFGCATDRNWAAAIECARVAAFAWIITYLCSDHHTLTLDWVVAVAGGGEVIGQIVTTVTAIILGDAALADACPVGVAAAALAGITIEATAVVVAEFLI